MLLCLMLSLQEKYSFCSNVWISRKCKVFCRESQKKSPWLVQVSAPVSGGLSGGLNGSQHENLSQPGGTPYSRYIAMLFFEGL